MSKSFTTAVTELAADQQADEYPFDFDLDGVEIRFRRPSDGEGIMLTAAMGRHMPKIERVAAVVDLFAAVLHPDVKDHVVRRLLDPHDSFGPNELFGLDESGENGILAYMLEEWSGRPTRR